MQQGDFYPPDFHHWFKIYMENLRRNEKIVTRCECCYKYQRDKYLRWRCYEDFDRCVNWGYCEFCCKNRIIDIINQLRRYMNLNFVG